MKGAAGAGSELSRALLALLSKPKKPGDRNFGATDVCETMAPQLGQKDSSRHDLLEQMGSRRKAEQTKDAPSTPAAAGVPSTAGSAGASSCPSALALARSTAPAGAFLIALAISPSLPDAADHELLALRPALPLVRG